MSWIAVVIFAIAMGIYTALMAMFVPDGNSFHDIAVTMEWWVLPAVLIIVNCKKPLEAALKTFVFFLISQPLVYLIQVPFNEMGWGLFGYYPYWFKITLLTFPAAFIAWFIKKDKWYSALILSGATVLLTLTGIVNINSFIETPPNHLISIIYCFAMSLIFIFAILKKKSTRAICLAITVIAALIYGILTVKTSRPYEVYNNTFIPNNNITFVGEPYISSWSSTGGKGNVEIISSELGYNFKISGSGYGKYYFTISDDKNEYYFEYYMDKEANTVIINRVE
jgi:hypothetical protein